MASNAYKIESVTTSVGTIGGVLDVSESNTSEVTTHKADNSANIEAVFLDNVGAVISVTTTATDLQGSYPIGQTVTALTIKKGRRANGTGATAAQFITSIYAEAIVTSVQDGVSTSGEGTLTIEFTAYDTAGNGLVAYATGVS